MAAEQPATIAADDVTVGEAPCTRSIAGRKRKRTPAKEQTVTPTLTLDEAHEYQLSLQQNIEALKRMLERVAQDDSEDEDSEDEIALDLLEETLMFGSQCEEMTATALERTTSRKVARCDTSPSNLAESDDDDDDDDDADDSDDDMPVVCIN